MYKITLFVDSDENGGGKAGAMNIEIPISSGDNLKVTGVSKNPDGSYSVSVEVLERSDIENDTVREIKTDLIPSKVEANVPFKGNSDNDPDFKDELHLKSELQEASDGVENDFDDAAEPQLRPGSFSSPEIEKPA